MQNKAMSPVKAGLGYTIGNILIKGIAFLSLPLFSRLMTTAEFGVFNVFISFETILSVIVGMGMHTSIQSANLEFKGEIDRYTSSVSLTYILTAMVLALVALVFGPLLESALAFSPAVLLCLVAYSFGTAIITLFNNRISLNYEYKKYLIVAFICAAGNVLVSILLMLTILSDKRDLGRIYGTTAVSFVLGVVLLFGFFRKAKPRVEKKYWKFAYKYSLPIVPHGVAQVLLGQVDRIMIRSMVNDDAAGIYSLGGNIKLILTVLTDSVMTAWRTWFFSAMDKGETAKIQRMASLISVGYTALTVGLLSVSHELVLLFGGRDYDEAKLVVIPMIADAFLLFLYSIVVQSEYFKKKTKYIMIGTMIAAAVNLVTNYIFIKMFGYAAAAWTTLGSYILYMVLHLAISRRVIGFHVLPMKILLILLSIVTAFSALNLIFVDQMFVRWPAGIIGFGVLIVYLMRQKEIRSLVQKKVKKTGDGCQ